MSISLASNSFEELKAIAERIASVARRNGGTPAALKKAAESALGRSGYRWHYQEGMVVVTTTSNPYGRCPTAYVSCHQSRTANGYQYLVDVHIDGGDTSSDCGIEIARVSWRILPPGEHPFERVMEHVHALEGKHPQIKFDLTRLRLLYGLEPTAIHAGLGELEGYFAFYFEHCRTAVLDCPRVGNAVYVIERADWAPLSRLTKKELLQHPNVRRIIHSGVWFDKVRLLVASRPLRRRGRDRILPVD